jgi:hypothetical protein
MSPRKIHHDQLTSGWSVLLINVHLDAQEGFAYFGVAIFDPKLTRKEVAIYSPDAEQIKYVVTLPDEYLGSNQPIVKLRGSLPYYVQKTLPAPQATAVLPPATNTIQDGYEGAALSSC